MSIDKRYYYGRVTTPSMFLDELQDRGVRLILQPGDADLRPHDDECSTYAARYPESRHADVQALCSSSGGAVATDVQLVDHDVDLSECASVSGAGRIQALSCFHQYGLAAASTDSERQLHERSLERLKTAWGRSMRLVERQPEETRSSDLGMIG